MPWPKGVPRIEDSDTVRPTAVSRALYVRFVVVAKARKLTLRAALDRAMELFIGDDDDD